MKRNRHIASSFMRLGAQLLVCLVAAFLLQLPLMAGVLIASGACCIGDHCPIATHHHGATKSEEAPMGCDHNMDHRGAKARSCSMSCCNTTEQAAVHSNVFLLSSVIELSSANPLPETISSFDASEVATPSAPLSPPPK